MMANEATLPAGVALLALVDSAPPPSRRTSFAGMTTMGQSFLPWPAIINPSQVRTHAQDR